MTAVVEVQPGNRPPAPGDLALVQAFINSHYDLELDRGADMMATAADLEAWLTRHGLIHEGRGSATPGTVTAADLERARAMREGLRELARANGDAEASAGAGVRSLKDAVRGITLKVNVDAGATLVPAATAGAGRALGLVLAATATAMIDGTWRRLKVCPGEDCGWAFYDHSRNRSGQWCSMSVCGGRSKARTHYQRRRERHQEP